MPTYHHFQPVNETFSGEANALCSQRASQMKYLPTLRQSALMPSFPALMYCNRSERDVTAKCRQNPFHEVTRQMMSLNAAFHLVGQAVTVNRHCH